jgi:hypothetical protein
VREDVTASINIKRVGLDVFPTIKRRKGNPVVVASTTNSTSKEALFLLYFLMIALKRPQRRQNPLKAGKRNKTGG